MLNISCSYNLTIMNIQNSCHSPTYKNLKLQVTGSPKEIKDRMRKDYKNKIQNSRNVLINKFRSFATGTDLKKTLTEIYDDTFKFANTFSQDGFLYDAEEMEMLEQIKKELIQDEVDWWIEEHEKSQMGNVDWSAFYQEEHVICPICQKNNLKLNMGVLSCFSCKISMNVTKKLSELKINIYDCITDHSSRCPSDGHFTVISEEQDTHIYFMCDQCAEINIVI